MAMLSRREQDPDRALAHFERFQRLAEDGSSRRAAEQSRAQRVTGRDDLHSRRERFRTDLNLDVDGRIVGDFV